MTFMVAGWSPAGEIQPGDLIHLECSTHAREHWCEVLESTACTWEQGLYPSQARWGDWYLRARTRWEEKRVTARRGEPVYEEESWVAQVLPAEKLVEVLRPGPESVELSVEQTSTEGEVTAEPGGPLRELLVNVDSLLSLAAYRGAGAVDEEWKADAIEVIREIRALTP